MTAGGSSIPVGTPGAEAAIRTDVELDASAAAEAATIGLIDEGRTPVTMGVGPVVDAGVVSAGNETPEMRGGASSGADRRFFVVEDESAEVVVDGTGAAFFDDVERVDFMVGSPLGSGLLPTGSWGA